MTIDELYQFVNFISNKTQSGAIRTSQFNLAANQAQLEFFNKQFRVFQTTKEVTDALAVWLKSVTLLVNDNGICNYPTDYMRMNAMYRIYFKDDESILVDIAETNDDEIGGALMSQIIQPTLKYPRVSYYGDYIKFYPKKIGSIQFDYFRQPTPPKWGFTVVNGRQVYDPATSVNLEVLPEFDTEISMMILSFMGINLREDQLIGYAEKMKQERP